MSLFASLNPAVIDWRGERIWVIGASSGIGAATAQLLLERGARVALSARKRDRLEAVAGTHTGALILPFDVTDVRSVEAAHKEILGLWGGCDRVLIVAGQYTEMRADGFALEAARALLDTNLQGVLNVLSVILPGMITRGSGAIGLVASVAGYRGLPQALIYGPSKAALINLAESLFIDLRPRGIAVNLICPGFVDTPLTAQNGFPMPALMTPAAAAQELVRGLERGQFEIHFPKRFTRVMKLLRLLPYRWYFYLIHRFTGL